MIPFSEIGTMIDKCKASHLRIFDLYQHKIADVITDSPDEAKKEIHAFGTLLQSYGKIIVKAGTASNFNQNFTGAAQWTVSFAPGTNVSLKGQQPEQENPTLLNLMVENMKLKLEKSYEDRLSKLEGGNKEEDKYLKYLPFVAPFLGVTDEQLFNRLQMSHMMSNPSMLKGLQQPQAQNLSADEKNRQIENLMSSIASKVDGNKILTLLAAIDKNPALADTAVNLLGGMKGMAGQQQEENTTQTNLPGLYMTGTDEDNF